MTDTLRPLERGGRRGRRRLSPVQKYEAFVQVLTGEMTVVECADHWGVGPLHDHAGARGRQEGRFGRVGVVSAGDALRWRGPGVGDGPRRGGPLGRGAQGDGGEGHLVGGKRALGVTAGVPPRVEAGTKAALLGLVDGAVDEGWTTARACAVLELDGRRCRRWQHRRGAGRLDDHTAGGTAGARHHPNRAPGDPGAVRALGRHRRRLPQARTPRLLREPGLGVTVDAVSRSRSPGAGSARPAPAHTGAGAAPCRTGSSGGATRSGSTT